MKQNPSKSIFTLNCPTISRSVMMSIGNYSHYLREVLSDILSKDKVEALFKEMEVLKIEKEKEKGRKANIPLAVVATDDIIFIIVTEFSADNFSPIMQMLMGKIVPLLVLKFSNHNKNETERNSVAESLMHQILDNFNIYLSPNHETTTKDIN